MKNFLLQCHPQNIFNIELCSFELWYVSSYMLNYIPTNGIKLKFKYIEHKLINQLKSATANI